MAAGGAVGVGIWHTMASDRAVPRSCLPGISAEMPSPRAPRCAALLLLLLLAERSRLHQLCTLGGSFAPRTPPVRVGVPPTVASWTPCAQPRRRTSAGSALSR